jgi:alpha-glucosidase (family GH31 glycosyl hydrolase)
MNSGILSALLSVSMMTPVLAQAPQQQQQRRTPGAAALEIAGQPVEVTITPVSERTLRFSISPVDASGAAMPAPDEPAIVAQKWPAPALRLRSAVGPQSLKAGSFKVVVTAEPLMFRVENSSGRVIQELRIADNGALTFVALGPLYGLGQGGVQFDRCGNRHQMRSGSVNLALNGMRVAVPWLMGSGWALYANRPRGEFDLSGSEGRYVPFSDEAAAPIDLFLAAADQPADLMAEYARLTGYPTMPPLWALGYQQSHRTVWDRAEMMEIADRLRRDKLPADVLIYLGTGWCPSGWNLRNGSFDFNPRMFPDPQKDIRELQSKNFKVILHSVMDRQPRLYGTVNDPPSPVPDASEARDYWQKHHDVSMLGIDGWWPDSGEGPSDASRMARIRMYWEGSQLDHPNVRPYALFRAGNAGMQRYGGWLWSGDVNSTWATLRNHIPMGINVGLSGIPLWGSDIGGFFSTKELTGELYVRWFQFGAFCPLFRSHGRPSSTRFPWGWNTGKFGAEEMDGVPRGSELPDIAELSNPKVEPIIRKYLELRYRLMPYLYSAVHETHETGLPVMRALLLHYSDDPLAAPRGDEYLWGRDILVAPVTEKAAVSRSLYLPRGAWYDLWTEAKIEGGREVTRDVDLETMPLYVRAGAIVPFGPVKQYTAEKSDEPVTLTVYPGADGRFVLYEDDGTTFNFEKGEFMKLRCEWNDRARQLTLSLEQGSKLLAPAPRNFKVRVAPSKETREVVFSGKPVVVKL